MNFRIEIVYSKKDKLSDKKLQFILELNQKNIPALGPLNNLQHVLDIYNHSLFSAHVTVQDKYAGFVFVMDHKSEYQSLNYKYFKNNFKNFLYIDRVAFEENFQRKGYGTELYNKIYKIANNLGSPLCCEVNTIPLNKQSLDFHDKFGFETLQKIAFGKKQVAMLCKY
ncbi:GNAT family N-acetyltransferase [Flavobacteriales bacterium]|nr:GNAT family N-acetyltransferase [Flavobacteriales bacterium]